MAERRRFDTDSTEWREGLNLAKKLAGINTRREALAAVHAFFKSEYAVQSVANAVVAEVPGYLGSKARAFITTQLKQRPENRIGYEEV